MSLSAIAKKTLILRGGLKRNNKNLVSFLGLFALASLATAAGRTEEATQARVLKLYSAVPAAFVENAGQIADPTVHYAFYGSGANIFHTTKGPVFQLFQRQKHTEQADQGPDEGTGFRGWHSHRLMDRKEFITRSCFFSIRFVGAKQVEPTGLDKQETKVNYFIGSDTNGWHTNVATYSKVVYPQLYNGIDLYTFGRRSYLKYEFHVAPRADLTQIIIGYEGIDSLSIDADGALHINTPLGELVDGAPHIYQIIDGKQVRISGRYHLIDEKSYTFEISGEIDPAAEVVIDPHLSWASYIGGTNYDRAEDIAVDPNGGALLLTGATNSTDFPGAEDPCGKYDAFVAKLSSSGDELLWAPYLGGDSNDDESYGVAVDTNSNVLITGATASPDFPATEGAYDTSYHGGTDAFVTKLDSSGDLVWSTFLGGGKDDIAYDIGVDSAGNPCVTGGTDSTGNGDLFPSHFTPQAGTTDAFVTKFSATPPLNHWQHKTYSNVLGGDGDDIGRAIAVTPLGNAVVTGCTTSMCNLGRLSDSSYSGKWDVFVTEVYPHYIDLADVWSCWLGGSDDDKGYGVDVGVDDKGSYVMVTGSTKSCDFPASGGFDNSYCGLSDAFVARLDFSPTEDPCNLYQPDLVSLAWASYLGGSVNDVGYDIVINDINQRSNPDLEDYALLTGFTSSYNFPTPDGFNPNHNGWEDAFVTEVTASGHLVWSSYLGGSSDDRGYGIAVDCNGDALLTGETKSNDFPAACSAFDCSYNDGTDSFIAKISKDEEIGFGKLYGNVWDPNGSPIADANVTVPGQITQTGANGQFSFDSNDGNLYTRDIFAGQTTVTVTKTDPNYYPVTKIVTIDVNSTTRVNITMTKEIQFPIEFTDPCVVDVRAKYCGPGKQDPYYMYGPSLCEKFVATIDWGNCEPNRVEWQTRGREALGDPCYTDTLSANTISGLTGGRKVTAHGRCFDMGGDDFGIGRGWVEVKAIGKMGIKEVSSSPSMVDSFDVTGPPGYVTDANDTDQVAVVFTGNGFEYKILKVPDFNLAPWDGSQVGTNIPIFGGKNMNVGLAQDEPSPHGSRLSATVNMDGTSFIFTKGYNGTTKKEVHNEVPIKGIELPELPGGVEVEASATADFFFTWETPPGEWEAGGTLDLGCTFSFSSPEFPGPPVFGVPTYTRADLSLDLGLSSTLQGWPGTEPDFSSNFYFEPLAKGILGAGVSDVACVEGYVGGGFHSEILLVPDVEWGDTYVILVGGVEVTIGPWSTDAGLEYNWWRNPGVHKTTVINIYQLLQSGDFTLSSRDYLDQTGPLVLGGNEGVIQSLVFPSCVPELVRLGSGITDSNMLTVWIDNDTNRSLCNGTELRYATYDGDNWTPPADVNDDGTADLNPQLISFGNGNAVCIWQDANAVLADCNALNLQSFNKHLEIAVWRYDSNWNKWINTALPNKWLTTNNYLDRSPKLAAVNENDMMAVWIRNEDGNTWGDASTATNKIMFSKYTGAWTAEYVIASNLGPILGTALAYDGNTATYVFCVDSYAGDPNINPQYQELYMATYSSSTGWSGPYQLTNDSTQPVMDAAPRLAYDNGNLLLFWVKGDSILMANGTGGTIEPDDVTYAQVVVTPGQSWGSKDFDLVMGDIGQIALVWSDVSVPDYPKHLDPNHFDLNRIEPNYVDPDSDLYRIPTPNEPNRIRVGYDIWVCYRDPCFGLWSLPRQLTCDDAAERFISGAFDPNGNLLCVYNKRQTEYYTYDYNDPNHHIIHVRDVPKAGRSDLVYLLDGLKCDLSIESEDVIVFPPNPMPGTPARILATVKNLGISPTSGTINFSNGFDGNEPIGSVLIVGSAAGDFDRNGYVDFGDLKLLAEYWLWEHCSIWNDCCERTDIYKDGRIDFKDFGLFTKDWHAIRIPGPVVGGDEADLLVDWLVPPESNSPRMIRVEVDPCNVQDDPNCNNMVSFNVLAPDLTISEMDVHIAGPNNTIITVRVANRGVLPAPAYDVNDQIKVVLRRDDPNGEIGDKLDEKAIQRIEPVSYYDVSFTLLPTPSDINMVYAVVDPNKTIDEFNEDNNTRSIRIR